MDIERFKSKLSRDAIKAMAIDTMKKYLDSTSPLEVLSFAKKLKVFTDELIRESEAEAKMVWDQEKSDYPEMSYTQGGVILDYNACEYRKALADQLREVDLALNFAHKSENPLFFINVFTGEQLEVPKVPVKGYRKDSINVKI